MRLLISFSLALVGHFYLLQFHLVADEPLPPELISDDSVSVTLNQYLQPTVPKPKSLPEIEPNQQKQNLEPPPERPDQPALNTVASVSRPAPEKPKRIEIRKESRKIKKKVVSQPKEVQVTASKPSQDEKLDHAYVQAEVKSQSKPQPVPTTPVVENKSVSVIKAQPLYQYNPKPKYPKIARKRGWEGTVMLRVGVDEKGGVLSVQLEKSCGYSILDKSALEAVKTWGFIAGTIAGKPTLSTVIVPVHFRLRK